MRRPATRVPSAAALCLLAAGLAVAAAVLLAGPSRRESPSAAQPRSAAPPAGAEGPRRAGPRERPERAPRRIPRRSAAERVRFRESRALGIPSAGRLVRGVRLPDRGRHFTTWDPVLKRSPNRGWRRWGTDDLVRVVLSVARRYAAAEPGALPMLVGDLSRPRGGDFGIRWGIVGHSTHQNGLDVDVYYPRRDGRPGVPRTPAAVDRRRAQQLVDLFVAAGSERVLVGPRVGLRGPAGVVVPWPNHDNHLHARIANPGG